MREEVVRPCLEACDDDAGVVDMLEDAHQALFNDTRDVQVTPWWSRTKADVCAMEVDKWFMEEYQQAHDAA
jgi:hypothetical protein